MHFWTQVEKRKYPFEMTQLPYKIEELNNEVITQEMMHYHYNCHYKNYINNLNHCIKNCKDKEFINYNLMQIINVSHTKKYSNLFNNASQVWNHEFLWNCISRNNTEKSNSSIIDKVISNFGSLEKFKSQFIDQSLSLFGSGWSWLLIDKNSGKMKITYTKNADCSFVHNISSKPLFTCDIWEHAYYLKYKSDKKRYLEQILDKTINWQFVENNYTIYTNNNK